MNIYFTLIAMHWQNGLVYKVSLLLWRLRQLLSSVMALTLWTVIYQGGDTTFGYSQGEMITFIFLASILQSAILSTMMHSLAQRVYTGEISNILLKPVNIFGYLMTQEIADKVKNLAFIALESALLYLAFRPQIILPTPMTLILCAVFTLGAVGLHFMIQLLLGSLGFWSPESWGPRFIFFMIVQIAAGKLFPLDILPSFIQQILYLTPFPYLSFIQTQLFLERIPADEIFRHGLILTSWIAISMYAAHRIWQHGMKDYAAAGQ